MPDLEHTRLMLRLAQDDLATMEVLETSHLISARILNRPEIARQVSDLIAHVEILIREVEPAK